MAPVPSGTSPVKSGRAAGRYMQGMAEREPFLYRARRISRLTITSMFRDQGATGASAVETPWQSLGGYGVNNLAAKLVLAMFPPGIPFINIKPADPDSSSLQMDPDTRANLRALVDKALTKQELLFSECVEEDGDRAVLFDTMRHLLIGGNHSVHVCDDAALQGIPLEEYVTWRDRRGNLQEFVIEQDLAFEELDDDVKAICIRNGYGPTENAEGDHKGDMNRPGSNWEVQDPIWEPVKVYTHGKYRHKMWTIYDEVMSEQVPGSSHPYNPDVMPYLFLRMVALKREHYGRSYCEDYEGDLQTYDGIWQALTEGGAAIARILTLVRPGSATNKEQYSKAATGSVMAGEKDDVYVVQADKSGDFSTLFQQSEKIEGRLERMFILNSAIERQGERVTATEVQFKAQELDTTLGGVYSNQVTTLQKPYAELKLRAYQRLGRMTKLPEGTTKITILTGDAGLGRGKKAQDILQFLQAMAQLFPQVFASYTNVGQAMARVGSNMFVDTDGLVKTDDQVQAEQQQQHMQALAQQATPNAVQAAGNMLGNTQQAAIAQSQQSDGQQSPQPPQGNQSDAS